jgi:hypothetical protein
MSRAGWAAIHAQRGFGRSYHYERKERLGMGRIRMIVALAVGVLSLGVLASPALALKTKPVFGKFRASTSGTVKGIGEAGEMVIGPYKFTECEKELKPTGTVVAGESETFFQEVKFSRCIADRQAGGGLEEPVVASFTLGMEFHSNGSLKFGPSSVTFQASNSTCEVTIPSQWVPASAETKGEDKSFELVSYETEREELEGAPMKKFGQFRERLDIEWELKGITATVKITPTCKYKGSHINAAGEAEFGGGRMEGELEEVTLQDGNLSFIPAPTG